MSPIRIYFSDFEGELKEVPPKEEGGAEDEFLNLPSDVDDGGDEDNDEIDDGDIDELTLDFDDTSSIVSQEQF